MALWLEGPMQSWGFESRFGYRGTAEFPTKSGVIGLILCALGKAGEQRELLANLASMTMTVVRYNRKNRDNEPTPEVLLTDFHMIGAGYEDKDKWQNLFKPKTASGTKGSGAYITYRGYLQDVAFGIVLDMTKEQAEFISSALVAPVWDLYLGRKSCAPTEVIFQGSYDNEADCEVKLSDLATTKNRAKSMTVFDAQREGELVILNDVPVSFGEHKEYSERVVTIVLDRDDE
jgi:CRISPR system Cascade subunit CasD